MADMMRLGPDRGGRFPTLALMVVAVPIACSFATWKWIEIKSLRPMAATISAMKKTASESQAEQDKMEKDLERMKRQVGALQVIAKVDIQWGGAVDKAKDKVAAKDTKVDFAFTHSGNQWVNPRESSGTVWYYTDKGDTLGRIAEQPRALGVYWLWPILAAENDLKVSGSDELPAGSMIRIPNRIGEWQIRHAITEAGTPDKAKDEILAQAGLKP